MFQITSISDLEKLSHAAKWQYFEKLVAFIFDENGFEARQNVVVRTGSGKRQFDVVAKSFGSTFLVECKKWRSRKEKTAALKSAVIKHLERCSLYAELNKKEHVIPLLVTLVDEDIAMHKDVPIVPIMKLDWLINNFDLAYPKPPFS